MVANEEKVLLKRHSGQFGVFFFWLVYLFLPWTSCCVGRCTRCRIARLMNWSSRCCGTRRFRTWWCRYKQRKVRRLTFTHVLFQFFKSHRHCLFQRKAKIMSTSRAKARGTVCCQPTLRPWSLKIRTWQMLSRWKWGVVMRFVQCERSCCQSSLKSVVERLL